MKLSRLLPVLLACAALRAFAQDNAAAPPTPADKAFAELRTVASAPHTIMNDRPRAEAMGRAQLQALSAAATELVVPLAEKFFADHPTDVRRWQAVSMLLSARRDFAGPDAPARKESWEKRRAELSDQLLAAPDAGEQTVASILEREVYAALGRGSEAPTPDLARAGELVELMARRVPQSDRPRFAERHYVEALTAKDPAAAEALLRRRAADADTNPALAQQCAGMLQAIDARRTPLELKFTALDGSTVDLADYRGKVVLIDFWATWCVPCMEEMPNVKRVHQAYRDKGFAIVGISLDRAPRDPAKPAAFEKTAVHLKEFLVKEAMPWPQHYDGKWWDNEFSRRFALSSIPAAFLIGKDGRIVSTDNHGEKLEANVRRALGL